MTVLCLAIKGASLKGSPVCEKRHWVKQFKINAQLQEMCKVRIHNQFSEPELMVLLWSDESTFHSFCFKKSWTSCPPGYIFTIQKIQTFLKIGLVIKVIWIFFCSTVFILFLNCALDLYQDMCKTSKNTYICWIADSCCALVAIGFRSKSRILFFQD